MSQIPNSDENHFNQTLLNITHTSLIEDAELNESFRHACEEVVNALNIDRCSVWFYSEDNEVITCSNLFDAKKKLHSSGQMLNQKTDPELFKVLNQNGPQALDSSMTIPIKVRDKTSGLILCQTLNKNKDWNDLEKCFLVKVTEIIERALKAKDRIKSISYLKETNSYLEHFIKDKNTQLEEQINVSISFSKMATLGQMAGSIAHEINNPLAIILGMLSMLRAMEQDEKTSKAEKLKVFDDIQETTLRIDKILKGLRIFAWDGSQDPFVDASLKQILDDTMALCAQKFIRKGSKLIVNFPAKDIRLRCQPVSISQALLNLLNNAGDAVEKSLIKWIQIDCIENESIVEFRVTDSGEGIDPKIADKVMTPFFTTKAQGKSSGLGLSIVKGIVDQHRGSFFIDHSNRNTSFVIHLPR